MSTTFRFGVIIAAAFALAIVATSFFKSSSSGPKRSVLQPLHLKGSSSCRQCTKFIPPVKLRTDIASLLESEKLRVGAELGVQRGEFSKSTLSVWSSCQRYYLVDLWAPQANYQDVANVGQEQQDKFLSDARSLLQPFNGKLVWMRNSTSQAASMIKEPLDYVYVDARHDCGVMEDLTLYWPLLKPGGILAGHDYADAAEVKPSGQDWSLCANGTRNEGAVMGAVNEFFAKQGVQIVVTYREGAWNSYLARKPHTCCEE